MVTKTHQHSFSDKNIFKLFISPKHIQYVGYVHMLISVHIVDNPDHTQFLNPLNRD